MVVAESLVEADGGINPESFSRRLIDWLPVGRGVGRATREAIQLLREGSPWWEAGASVESSGNGAAMRVAPVGIAHALDQSPRSLMRLAIGYSLPTHAGSVGVAGAVAMALGVAYVLRASLRPEQEFNSRAFLSSWLERSDASS